MERRRVQQFEAFVESAGIGIAGGGDRQQRLEFAEQFGTQSAFTCGQPVAVALDGVDLAVVRQLAERLCQRPAWERVGGEAGMDDGDFRLHAFVGQVKEEGLELHGGEHALVGDGAGGQGREVDAYLVFHALTDAEGLAVEFDATELAFRIGHDQRLDAGMLARACRPSPSGLVGTTRHASTSRPSSRTILEMACSCWPEVAMSRSKKAMPAA